MPQIDFYLRRVVSECTLELQQDIYQIYENIENADLRTLFSVYHTQLNKWFQKMNSDLRYTLNEKGERVPSGGYFHADDSRAYLSLLEQIEKVQSSCINTIYRFVFCDNEYKRLIKDTKDFVRKSCGSTIPDNFTKIQINELTPVFQLATSKTIRRDRAITCQLQSVGEGSYAKVYRYIDPDLEIPVILKKAKELDDKEKERFKQEFDILKKLHSPYLVEVYSFDESKMQYTMESLDATVYEYVRKRNDSLSLTARKKLIFQICSGLKYIHGKGIFHRDISLCNVFIKQYDDTPIAKIGDFGLVKVPNSQLTSVQSELKGSLNDTDLINVGFANYEIRHETYALTRLCYYILTGRTNINKEKNDMFLKFWNKGTSPNIENRFSSVSELEAEIKSMAD